MHYLELFKILSKSWLDVNDIRKIGSCGKDNATIIRNKIIKSIEEQGYNLPIAKSKLVPTNEVINYFNLDIDYISDMAAREKKLAPAD